MERIKKGMIVRCGSVCGNAMAKILTGKETKRGFWVQYGHQQFEGFQPWTFKGWLKEKDMKI